MQLMSSEDGGAVFHGNIKQNKKDDFSDWGGNSSSDAVNQRFVQYCSWLAKRRIASKKFHFPAAFVRDRKNFDIICSSISSRVEDLSLPKSIVGSDVDLYTIIVFGGCSSLIRLNVNSGKLSDKAVSYIASVCSNLKELNMMLSDMSLASIAGGCSQLEVLDIRCCYKVTDKGLERSAEEVHG